MQQSQPIVTVSEHVPSDSDDEVSLLYRFLSSPPGENDRTFVLEIPDRVNLAEFDIGSKRYFVGQVSQLIKLMEDINSTSCVRPNCKGGLKLAEGLGGVAKVSFACSECKGHNIDFQTSAYDEQGACVTSKALQVASICSGLAYRHYKRMLNHVLGMQTVSSAMFYHTLCEMHSHVKNVLDSICEEARKDMQSTLLGSWSRAVTSVMVCG